MGPNRIQDDEYGYFDHDADVGIVGRGKTMESAFEAAAGAMFAVMVDPRAVQPETSVCLAFEETDPELALIVWLNGLLAEARSERLALGRFRLCRRNGQWRGEAWGEPWREDLERGVEVKGATLTMLSVQPGDGGWEARCVVDV